MQFVDEGRLRAALAGAPDVFRSADPFPHVVIDGFLKPEVADRLEAGFPPVEHKIWKHHLHRHSHKFAGPVGLPHHPGTEVQRPRLRPQRLLP